MNREEIIKLINENLSCHLATSENNQPHVRGMMVYKADENGVIFHTGQTKDLCSQIKSNPLVELCFFDSKNNIQVRVTGKAVIKEDLECFGEGLKRIQNIGFKKVEISLQHEIVKKTLTFFEDYGVKAFGMSSFGPSVIGIVESDEEANNLLKAAQQHLNGNGAHIYLCKPNNIGAKIEFVDEK